MITNLLRCRTWLLPFDAGYNVAALPPSKTKLCSKYSSKLRLKPHRFLNMLSIPHHKLYYTLGFNVHQPHLISNTCFAETLITFSFYLPLVTTVRRTPISQPFMQICSHLIISWKSTVSPGHTYLTYTQYKYSSLTIILSPSRIKHLLPLRRSPRKLQQQFIPLLTIGRTFCQKGRDL